MTDPIKPVIPTDNPADHKPQELNYQQDIHNRDVRDIVAEEWNEDENWGGEKPQEPIKPVEPVTPVEEAKPAAPVTPPPAEPIKPQEPVKPVDEEKLTDAMVEKLYNKLSPQTVEEKKDFQAKLKDLNEKAKTEGRQPTYEEALELLGGHLEEDLTAKLEDKLTKKVMENLNKEVDEEEKKIAQTKKQQEETKAANEKRLYGEWDRQLGILIGRGDIPKVVNKDDPEDPGVKAQEVLFKALNATTKEQQEKGLPVSLNLVEAFMSPHYKALTDQPGKDAPVYGAKKSVASSGNQGINYMKDIHNASLEELIAEAYNDNQG